MIRKTIKWPLTVSLGLFLLLQLQQAAGILSRGEDWSGAYLSVEATIVDSVEVEWPGSTTDARNIDRVTCEPVLEIEVDGVKYRPEAPWLIQRYNRTRGPDCMDYAYGDNLMVLWTPDEPAYIYDPDNPPTAEETAYANVGIAAILLLLLWFLWRPGRPETPSPS